MVFYGRPDGVPSLFVYAGVQGGYVRLVLTGGNFSRLARSAAVAAKTKKPVRRLWGSGKGKFSTKGKYAAATIRGTIWQIADFKDGTLVLVKRGVVAVQGLAKHKTVLVKAGHSYFAARKTSSPRAGPIAGRPSSSSFARRPCRASGTSPSTSPGYRR